jgi:hypothetical protein
LLIAESSIVLIEIFPLPISLNAMTVFLSSSIGTKDLSPALSCVVLSLASNTKSYWLSIFSKQLKTQQLTN